MGFDIDITQEQIFSLDKSSQVNTSGMYHFTIKQARLVLSQKTESKGLGLLLKIDKDHLKNSYDTEIEIVIWFIKSDGSLIDFLVSKIGSMLGLLEMPLKLNSNSFENGEVIVKSFDTQSNTFIEKTDAGLVLKDLVGKDLWAVISVTYQEYNNIVSKKFDIISFQNNQAQSYTEFINGKEARMWAKRLKSAKEKEKETYEQFNQTQTKPTQNQNVISGEEFLKKLNDAKNDMPSIDINDDEIPF